MALIYITRQVPAISEARWLRLIAFCRALGGLAPRAPRQLGRGQATATMVVREGSGESRVVHPSSRVLILSSMRAPPPYAQVEIGLVAKAPGDFLGNRCLVHLEVRSRSRTRHARAFHSSLPWIPAPHIRTRRPQGTVRRARSTIFFTRAQGHAETLLAPLVLSGECMA